MGSRIRSRLIFIALMLLVIAAVIILPRFLIVAEIAGRELFLMRSLIIPAALIFGFLYVTRNRKE
jgi:hypothetical protein